MTAGLDGQWALVTGASKGIGYAIGEALVGAGANVVLVARNPDDLEAARAELEKVAGDGQQVLARPADTADRDAIADLFTWARAELPGLNILVANAGSGAVLPFLDLTLEAWDATVALNLTGTFLCMQHAARSMVEMPADANRSIVVVSSIRALGIRPGLAAYASTKAAVNQLVRMAAYELAAARHPGQRPLAGHHGHPAGGREPEGQPRHPGRAHRRRADGSAGPAGGHGQRRPLPVPAGVTVRHRHELHRRRRRAPALRS